MDAEMSPVEPTTATSHPPASSQTGAKLAPSATLAMKVLYALLFNVALPAVLILWAKRSESLRFGPPIYAPRAGVGLIGLGVFTIGSGWWALWHHGGGLAMNAFPPPKHVSRGIYRVFEHPIYVGAVTLLVGVAFVTGSASTLWLIAPLLTLAAGALVLGHERLDLKARFGAAQAGLAIDGRPGTPTRLGYGLHAVGPWLLYFAAETLWNGEWPTAALWGPFAALLLLPLGLRSPKALTTAWRWARRAWVAEVLLALAGGPMAGLLQGLRLAVAVALGVTAGWWWEQARRMAEGIANSWREWQFGPLRIISHGTYAGLGAGGGVWIVSALVGAHGEPAVAIATLGGLLGSALWAQVIEGASGLSRPYGFYGGLLGIVAAACFAPYFGVDIWLLLTAFTLAAPWIQSIGRLRCLVQGCCHGREAPPQLGIRHTHARSRVVRLSTLGGTPVHPTALYSILWNAVIAIIVWRAWASALPLHAIAGLYLILGGIGRFAEEAYRGEPQTPVHYGLRLYQWVAIASVLAGIACMSFGSSAPAPAPSWSSSPLPLAIALGLVVGAALGIDFPRSQRRFSRLA